MQLRSGTAYLYRQAAKVLVQGCEERLVLDDGRALFSHFSISESDRVKIVIRLFRITSSEY